MITNVLPPFSWFTVYLAIHRRVVPYHDRGRPLSVRKNNSRTKICGLGLKHLWPWPWRALAWPWPQTPLALALNLKGANLPNRYSALCWRPVTHAQIWASYSALYRFGRLSLKGTGLGLSHSDRLIFSMI